MEPSCCSCHLHAPCDYCLSCCVECGEYVGEEILASEDGICEDCLNGEE